MTLRRILELLLARRPRAEIRFYGAENWELVSGFLRRTTKPLSELEGFGFDNAGNLTLLLDANIFAYIGEVRENEDLHDY